MICKLRTGLDCVQFSHRLNRSHCIYQNNILRISAAGKSTMSVEMFISCGSFSKIPSKLLFTEQHIMDSSAANIDLDNTANSCSPIASFRFTSGLGLQTINRRAKRYRSSRSSTTLSSAVNFLGCALPVFASSEVTTGWQLLFGSILQQSFWTVGSLSHYGCRDLLIHCQVQLIW